MFGRSYANKIRYDNGMVRTQAQQRSARGENERARTALANYESQVSEEPIPLLNSYEKRG